MIQLFIFNLNLVWMWYFDRNLMHWIYFTFIFYFFLFSYYCEKLSTIRYKKKQLVGIHCVHYFV